mmetsp:Transcript_136822/g.324206  ORF Transcript_136822/g.324206 Transcript_136822/m.324206 type:complete len:97 (+) Transcript_136822:127-417(+)
MLSSCFLTCCDQLLVFDEDAWVDTSSSAFFGEPQWLLYVCVNCCRCRQRCWQIRPLEQSHQSAGLLWGMVPVPLRKACTLYHGTERRLPASSPVSS